MFSADQYQLIDFGDGRRLERFGPQVIDRPSPVVVNAVRLEPAQWKTAHARFERQSASRGTWVTARAAGSSWRITHGDLVFELKCTASGAVGVYPEQAENWDWIEKQVRRACQRLKVLHLFAYTGGSTLAAASAGAEVVHVDAARSAVHWAHRNARHSGLQDAAIRWIVEDARQFVRREIQRGHQYDAVILDPPTYGHGPKAQPWLLDQHLGELLRSIGQLTRQRRAFILLTCHAPGMGPAALAAMLSATLFGQARSGVSSKRLFLRRQDGKRLASGVVARWPAGG